MLSAPRVRSKCVLRCICLKRDGRPRDVQPWSALGSGGRVTLKTRSLALACGPAARAAAVGAIPDPGPVAPAAAARSTGLPRARGSGGLITRSGQVTRSRVNKSPTAPPLLRGATSLRRQSRRTEVAYFLTAVPSGLLLHSLPSQWSARTTEGTDVRHGCAGLLVTSMLRRTR